MTDRVAHLTVYLDRDMTDEDVECVMRAMRMVKFVSKVEPHIIDNKDYRARDRIQRQVSDHMRRVVDLVMDGDRELVDLLERKKRERGY